MATQLIGPTFLDLIAFDLARREAAKTNTHIPCWMVMSDEAKEKMRADVLKLLSTGIGRNVDEEDVERLARTTIADADGKMQEWLDAELARAAEREEGNPRAFFV